MLTLFAAGAVGAACGLNAPAVLLLVALFARYTAVVAPPPTLEWIGGPWVVAAAALLLLVEFAADKIPFVDSVNDAVQTLLRPAAGAVAAGTVAGGVVAGGDVRAVAVLGAAAALLVHLPKALLRPLVDQGSGGLGGPLVSVIEDTAAVALAVVALFAPVLAPLAVAAVFALYAVLWRRFRPPGRLRVAHFRPRWPT